MLGSAVVTFQHTVVGDVADQGLTGGIQELEAVWTQTLHPVDPGTAIDLHRGMVSPEGLDFKLEPGFTTPMVLCDSVCQINHLGNRRCRWPAPDDGLAFSAVLLEGQTSMPAAQGVLI